jgi:DNA (cytosine-5)-methyltransferase 1
MIELCYGSVCSGIEAASVAWHPLGWRAAFFSEIEAFPRAVLAERWPGVPIHGDFTTINEGDYEAIDLLVGGTPCQDFSVAGLRAGLAGNRGGLTIEFVHLARRLRPRWLVWENVPGILSIDDGRAFGAFLALLGQCGYGFAYRVLDAQHFGGPQRRRRVVVGHLGDWRPAAAVLFEPESLRVDTAPRREAGERVARPIAGCAEGGSGWRGDADTADNLIAPTIDIAPAMTTRTGTGTGNAGMDDYCITHSLRADGFDAGEDGTGRGTPLVMAFDGHASPGEGRPSPTLVGGNKGGGKNELNLPCALQGMSVRRLTPRECERLQGFPDDYTAITYRGKPAAEGSRYRALGNSMAVPCMRWLGERIAMVQRMTA